MPLTPSTMLPLGTAAFAFALPEVLHNKTVSLDSMKSKKGTLIMFVCNHCPYVKHIMKELIAFANECVSKGIAVIAISSNDAVQYPDDGPDAMKVLAKEFKFPYCYDETQSVARAYDAACTPDFYLFDGHLSLVYRGQFDDARPSKPTPVTGKDLKHAVEALLAGKTISDNQQPSMGCNIKWKQ